MKNEPFGLRDLVGVTREEASAYLVTLEKETAKVKEWLDRNSGAHPTLVALKLEGFPEPKCDGGYHFAEEPSLKLCQGRDGTWALTVVVRYEHDDDRGGQFERHDYLVVDNGKLYSGWSGKQELADADDLEACKAALTKRFWTDGG